MVSLQVLPQDEADPAYYLLVGQQKRNATALAYQAHGKVPCLIEV